MKVYAQTEECIAKFIPQALNPEFSSVLFVLPDKSEKDKGLKDAYYDKMGEDLQFPTGWLWKEGQFNRVRNKKIKQIRRKFEYFRIANRGQLASMDLTHFDYVLIEDEEILIDANTQISWFESTAYYQFLEVKSNNYYAEMGKPSTYDWKCLFPKAKYSLRFKRLINEI